MRVPLGRQERPQPPCNEQPGIYPDVSPVRGRGAGAQSMSVVALIHHREREDRNARGGNDTAVEPH